MSKFTDRYVKLPTKIYEAKLKELTGHEGELEDSYSKVNPLSIIEYRPTEADEQEYTQVFFNSGGSLLCYLPIDEFERVLNDHQK